nr:vegetative cell wall protein gp1-like [Anser cygnoides]
MSFSAGSWWLPGCLQWPRCRREKKKKKKPCPPRSPAPLQNAPSPESIASASGRKMAATPALSGPPLPLLAPPPSRGLPGPGSSLSCFQWPRCRKKKACMSRSPAPPQNASAPEPIALEETPFSNQQVHIAAGAVPCSTGTRAMMP